MVSQKWGVITRGAKKIAFQKNGSKFVFRFSKIYTENIAFHDGDEELFNKMSIKRKGRER